MLVFIDVETTGLEEIDKICSIALVIVENEDVKTMYDLVNEGKKISPKASSINHITNEMLKGKPKLTDSQAYKFLQANNNESITLIAHNIKFDLAMLAKSGFSWMGNTIDTLRVSKHLVAECEQFSLQFLRYELKLYKSESKESLAHNALSDALHVKLLYEYLLDMATCREMIELSQKHVLLQKFNFGKYTGRYIEDISINDRAYLEWMLTNILDLDDDLRYSVTHYLAGN